MAHLLVWPSYGDNSIPSQSHHFFILAIIAVDRGRNPLRTFLVPLLASLGTLLGMMDGDIEWCLLAATQGRLPVVWGRVKFSCLIAGGILGGNATQLLGGVPKNIIQCLEGRRLLCVAHTAFGCLHPWPLGITAVSLSVAVFALAQVPHAMFGLHAHVP
jgi:hypothetical protein